MVRHLKIGTLVQKLDKFLLKTLKKKTRHFFQLFTVQRCDIWQLRMIPITSTHCYTSQRSHFSGICINITSNLINYAQGGATYIIQGILKIFHSIYYYDKEVRTSNNKVVSVAAIYGDAFHSKTEYTLINAYIFLFYLQVQITKQLQHLNHWKVFQCSGPVNVGLTGKPRVSIKVMSYGPPYD